MVASDSPRTTSALAFADARMRFILKYVGTGLVAAGD